MSTRARLTVAYAMLLMVTLIVFAIGVSLVYPTRAENVREEAQRSADYIATVIRQRQFGDTTHNLTFPDTSRRPPVARIEHRS